MELPPFVYSLAFWEGVSFVIAGILALLAYFKKLPEKYKLPAAAILLAILAVLKFFGVVPELLARHLIK